MFNGISAMSRRSDPFDCSMFDHEFSRRSLLRGAVAGGVAFGGFGRLFSPASAAEAETLDARRKSDTELFNLHSGTSSGPEMTQLMD